MRNMTVQEIGLGLVVVTICVSFFAVLVLAALGYPVPGELLTVVIALFSGVASGIPSYLFAARLGEAKEAAHTNALRAENAQLVVSHLRAGLDIPK